MIERADAARTRAPVKAAPPFGDGGGGRFEVRSVAGPARARRRCRGSPRRSRLESFFATSMVQARRSPVPSRRSRPRRPSRRGRRRRGPAARRLADHRRVLDRRGPEDDARRAEVEVGAHRVERADPAADLHARPEGSDDASNHLERDRPPGTRALEVDDVKPPRRAREPRGLGFWILGVDGDVVVAPLPEGERRGRRGCRSRDRSPKRAALLFRCCGKISLILEWKVS